jgi:hypothetical protein
MRTLEQRLSDCEARIFVLESLMVHVELPLDWDDLEWCIGELSGRENDWGPVTEVPLRKWKRDTIESWQESPAECFRHRISKELVSHTRAFAALQHAIKETL